MKLKLGQNPADLVMQQEGIDQPRMKEHHNFYMRSIFNALLPNFFDRYDYITEDDVSGELIEALRLVQETYAPDLAEGEMVHINYDKINDLYDLDSIFEDYQVEGIGDEIKFALGNFAMTRKDGQIVVMDAYDFPQSGEVDTIADTFTTIRKKGGISYYPARYLGEKLMPAKRGNNDGYNALQDPDITQVRITLPDQPKTENIDFDDFAEADTNEYVMQGPMTNKRQAAWIRIKGSIAPPPKPEVPQS